MKKLGRNDPCHCGSGLKYKKCCLSKDEAANVTRIGAEQPSSLVDTIDRNFEWPNELHRLIAHHFIKNTEGLYKFEEILSLLLAWNTYALAEVPVSRKLGVYPSALEYILCQIYEYEVTQSELAEKYGVSVTILSQRAGQFFDFLTTQTDLLDEPSAPHQISSGGAGSAMMMEQEMARLHALLEEQDFDSVDDVNAFLNRNIDKKPSPGRRKASKEEQAADLLYQAWNETNPQRRIKLAQDALLLDPSNGDAYNVLAESTTVPKEMAYYHKQGMLTEEKRLGEACFEENKGHFWMYMPTRPYMRAKKGYAEACAMMGNLSAAIKHYRELLELNPNDNQGVRDLLFSAYIESEDWKGAEQIIEQFDGDGSSAFTYGRVLVEYGLNGTTPKLTSLIKAAVAQNPFVPPYLHGKKRLPRSMPEYMGFGDDREASVYAMMNHYLWTGKPELLRLLPAGKK